MEWSKSNNKSNHSISVMKPFKMDSNNSRLMVDIISDDGNTWIKVIARNPKALSLISLGNGEYGQKSILDQAKYFLTCASMHLHCYKPPNIIFYFACGIESFLANQLEELGISVEGKRIADITDTSIIEFESKFDLNEFILDNLKNHSISSCNKSLLISTNKEKTSSSVTTTNILSKKLETFNVSPQKLLSIETLNIDVSSLLAYVSNMTNGHANFIFLEPLLNLQAEWERSSPVKPILDQWFEGKRLLVCKTAYDNFMDIIKTIGGVNEKLRAEAFMRKVQIIEDADEGRILQLPIVGRIKHRSRIVFGTGEFTKSITITANEGFVRAAKMQEIECAVMLHEPRSLSEIKEKNAKKLNDHTDNKSTETN
ncbi:UPF0415 protein C7orf25 homolog isoform X2 [Chelonus insularis]|nr:UPF0415 protein C7orf25 homolog isoform X2 [Chelonus insularis]